MILDASDTGASFLQVFYSLYYFFPLLNLIADNREFPCESSHIFVVFLEYFILKERGESE